MHVYCIGLTLVHVRFAYGTGELRCVRGQCGRSGALMTDKNGDQEPLMTGKTYIN